MRLFWRPVNIYYQWTLWFVMESLVKVLFEECYSAEKPHMQSNVLTKVQRKILQWASGGIMESLVRVLLLAQNSCLNCPPLSLLLLCTSPLFFITLHRTKVLHSASHMFSLEQSLSASHPLETASCPHHHWGQKLSLSDFTLFTFCPASPLFCASDMTPFLLFLSPSSFLLLGLFYDEVI